VLDLTDVLKEYRDAEWMGTFDWGGDREGLLAKVDNALESIKGEG